MIGAVLKSMSIAFILSIYDVISEAASNNKTIIDLNKKEYFDVEVNSNYKIMNLLMEESACRFKAMTDKAEKLMKETPVDIVKKIIPMIVRKYFLCHEVPQTSHRQHVIDVFFDKEDKHNIKIAQQQNKMLRK